MRIRYGDLHGISKGTAAEDEIRFSVAGVLIKNAPELLYADSTSDYPICFKVYWSEDILLGDISEIEGYIFIDEKKYTLDIDKKTDIVEGNIVDNTDFGNNVFSLLVKEKEFNSIDIEEDISIDVKFKIKLTLINKRKLESLYYSIERFGDKDIEVYDIGKDDEIDSTSTQKRMRGCNQPATGEFIHLDAEHPWYGHDVFPHYDEKPYGFDVYSKYTSGTKNLKRYVLHTKLYDDFDWSGLYGGNLYRAGVYNEQRGIYFGIYYGFKKVNGREVVDITKKIGRLKIVGFQSAFFIANWRSVDNKTDIDWPILTLSAVATTVGFAISPQVWPAAALALITSVGPTLLEMVKGDIDEKADFAGFSAIVVNDENGNEKSFDSTPNNLRLITNVTGTGSVRTTRGAMIHELNEYCKTGETFYAYTSGSVYCQARSAYVLWSRIEATLRYVNPDPVVYLESSN